MVFLRRKESFQLSTFTCFSLMSFAKNCEAGEPCEQLSIFNFQLFEDVPPLSLRYAFASGSLSSMEHLRTYNGFITVLQRTHFCSR